MGPWGQLCLLPMDHQHYPSLCCVCSTVCTSHISVIRLPHKRLSQSNLSFLKDPCSSLPRPVASALTGCGNEHSTEGNSCPQLLSSSSLNLLQSGFCRVSFFQLPLLFIWAAQKRFQGSKVQNIEKLPALGFQPQISGEEVLEIQNCEKQSCNTPCVKQNFSFQEWIEFRICLFFFFFPFCIRKVSLLKLLSQGDYVFTLEVLIFTWHPGLYLW